MNKAYNWHRLRPIEFEVHGKGESKTNFPLLFMSLKLFPHRSGPAGSSTLRPSRDHFWLLNSGSWLLQKMFFAKRTQSYSMFTEDFEK
jgi:hypothetical protein